MLLEKPDWNLLLVDEPSYLPQHGFLVNKRLKLHRSYIWSCMGIGLRAK